MRVLITGGFGNVGIAVIDEFLKRKHDVTVLELETSKTRRIARIFGNKINLVWGNILDKDALIQIVEKVDIVVHLVGIIPPKSEENRELCFAINVKGTENILDAIKETGNQAKLIFTSSASVMGPTQHKNPPINPYDEVNPTTNYTHSKVEAEHVIQNSGVIHCIFRLGAVLSSKGQFDMNLASEAFNINLDSRVEMILDLDIATAMNNAAEQFMKHEKLNGTILNIGGGKQNGFQKYGRDLTLNLFKRMGMGDVNPNCFCTEDYMIDWMDTKESQKLLKFQNHSYEEAIELNLAPFKKFQPFIKLFAPVIRYSLERKSPYL